MDSGYKSSPGDKFRIDNYGPAAMINYGPGGFERRKPDGFAGVTAFRGTRKD